MSFAKICQKQSIEFVEWITQEYPETLGEVSQDVFVRAIKQCKTEFVKRLIDNGIDVNTSSFYGRPLEVAFGLPINTAMNSPAIAAMLLQHKDLNLNIYGPKSCRHTLKWLLTRPDLLRLALQNKYVGRCVNDLGLALCCACTTRNVEALKLLLSHPKADVNRTYTTKTPLMTVISTDGPRKQEIVEILLARPEIKINKKDDRSRTAFHHAIVNKEKDIARLISSRCDFNASVCTFRGQMQLEFACEKIPGFIPETNEHSFVSRNRRLNNVYRTSLNKN